MERLRKSTLFFNFIYLFDIIEERDRIIETCCAYRISKNEFPEDFIHSVYPDIGGLFPCGLTDNGDEIYWLTSDWSLIVYETRSSDFYKYSMTITEFIYKIANKELVCPAFPDDL